MAVPGGLRKVAVAACLLAATLIAAARPAHAAPCTIEIRPEMELLAGALTQTDWIETRSPVSDGNEYYRALAAFFRPYHHHRAVQLLNNLAGLGFTYELPPSFICHLGPLPDLDLKYEYADDLIWAAGNRETLEDLRTALRDLAVESNFAAFAERWQGSYDEWVARAADCPSGPTVVWLEDFFGTGAAEYHIILSPAMFPSGGYAASATAATGERAVFAVIREPGRSISDPEIPTGTQLASLALHEWGHSFVNPLVAARRSQTAALTTVYWRTMRAMKRQGYGSLEAFLDEQILRAVTSLAAGDLLGPEALAEEANYHETHGFYLTRPVIELLREYQAERGTYRTFADFLPRLLEGLMPYRVVIPPWAVAAALVTIGGLAWSRLRRALAERADRQRRWLNRQPWIWQ